MRKLMFYEYSNFQNFKYILYEHQKSRDLNIFLVVTKRWELGCAQPNK